MYICAFEALRLAGVQGRPRYAKALDTHYYALRCALPSDNADKSAIRSNANVAIRCVNSNGPLRVHTCRHYLRVATRRSNEALTAFASRKFATAAQSLGHANATPDSTYKFPRLSKRTLKKVKSIERLYRSPTAEEEFADTCVHPKNAAIHVQTIPLVIQSAPDDEKKLPSNLTHEYDATKSLVKSIYKAATGGVFNDALWSRYVHKLSIVAGVLLPPDICIVMYSFAKVRYRDHQMLKIMAPIIVRNLHNMSCGGLALVLNSIKRLEIRNYDIIDLATNEICIKMDHANLQDIALTANALAFFHIYHHRFWNMLTKAASLRHHQMTPLQAALILAAVAKMDIRNPLLLRLLKDKLRPAIEKGEVGQDLLTLSFHSFAKLDFVAKNLYDACVERFANILAESPDIVDSQSLVLYLYTAVCVLDIPLETVKTSLNLLSTREDIYKNYKALKLKYVFDHLKFKHPAFSQAFSNDIKALQQKIQDYKLQKIQRKLSRWAMEVSRILQAHGVKHTRNTRFDYMYADIYIKEYDVAIKCAGPYSYYAMSKKLTVFAQVEINTMTMMGIKVCLLPYHEWNALRTLDDKLNYLKKFGEDWAAMHFPQPTEDGIENTEQPTLELQ